MKLNASLLGLFMIGCLGSYAQADDKAYDQRLLSHFSAEQIDKMADKSPATLAYWSYYLENGFLISDIPHQKNVLFDGAFTDSESFNPFASNIVPLSGKTQYYEDKKNDRMLLVYSKEVLLMKFQSHQSTQTN